MEFQYLQKVVLPQAPQFNYEELKHDIEQKCSEYETVVYTDDQIKLAKADKAQLNKLKKALNDERITRQAEWNAPFLEFKVKVDELIKIIDRPIQMIDKQVKEYDRLQDEKKHAEIVEIWNSTDKPDWLKLESVFDDKWMLKSTSLAKVKSSIDEIIATINRNVDTLSKLPEYSFEAIEMFKETLTLGKALEESYRLTELRKRKEEAEAQKSQETQMPSDTQKCPNNESNSTGVEIIEYDTKTAPVEAVANADNKPRHNDKLHHVVFETNITMDQALKLRSFCDSVGITLKQIR